MIRGGALRSRCLERGTVLLLVLLAQLGVAVGAAQADPRSDLLFHRGVAEYGDEDYAAARAAFESYLEKNPDSAEAHRYLGLIQRNAGETDAAIASFRSAIAADPKDEQAHLGLVETLLDAHRNEEARQAATEALVYQPDDANLQLYAGIAEYRVGDPGKAIDHLDRAMQLDPELTREARYYVGLAQAILGNLYASSGALGDVVDVSPGHPLGISAQNLRQQMLPSIPGRRWYLSTTAGALWDSNPAVASDIQSPVSKGAGSLRVRGLVDAYRGQGLTLRAGYEGFLAYYGSDFFFNEQTHVFKALALYDRKNVRMSLRYDYALTLLDLTEKFRGLQLIEPEVNFRLGRFGITQFYYQFLDYSFFIPPITQSFDRNGLQHTVGANQIFVLNEPLNYARIGILYTDRDTDGTEFAYSGFEVNAGAGMVLPWHSISASVLYRFGRFDYKNITDFNEKFGEIRRTENVHNFSVDISAPVWRQLEVAVSATITAASSQVTDLNFDRQIVGTYLTWTF